jgi:chemotaxis signal transduction protein
VLWILADLMQESLAIPGTDVLEVVPAIAPSPIAGCSSPWQGVICYRGAIVPVMDLCERFNIPTTPPSMRQRILIMRPHQDIKVALKVPSVRALSDEEIRAAQDSMHAPMIRHLPICEIFAEPYYRIAESMLKGIRS